MHHYKFQIILSIITFVISALILVLTRRYITHFSNSKGFSDHRKVYVNNFFSAILIIIILFLYLSIWDISVDGISIFISSFFTLLGVAFVAQWSLLSNITGSLLLFFMYPFKIGDQIRIQDGGENSVEGKILNITLFNIRILTEEGIEVAYPNNLAIQKPIKLIKAQSKRKSTKSS